jgi:hypothetical protein
MKQNKTKLDIKKELNYILNKKYKTNRINYIDNDDINYMLNKAFNYIVEDKEYIINQLPNINTFSDIVFFILSQYTLVIDQSKGLIDYGTYSYNSYLNPYLNDETISFINMDILVDYF